MKRPLRLLCCLVGIGLGTSAGAAPTCTVAASPSLSFGSVIALANSADADANTGSSFWVNCNNEVAAAPTLYSGSERTMFSGASRLPFQLSLSTPGGTQLPSQFPGATLDMVNDGTNQTVTLHGRLRAVDFRVLPGGFYGQSIELTIEY